MYINFLYNLIIMDGIYTSMYFAWIKFNNYHLNTREMIENTKLYTSSIYNRYVWYMFISIFFYNSPTVLRISVILFHNPHFWNNIIISYGAFYFRIVHHIHFHVIKLLFTLYILEHIPIANINTYQLYSILNYDNMIQFTCNYIMFLIMTYLKHKDIFYYYYKLMKYLYFYNSGYKYETKDPDIVESYFSQIITNDTWIIELSSPLFANCLILMGMYNNFYSNIYYDIQYNFLLHTFLWSFAYIFDSYSIIFILITILNSNDNFYIHFIRLLYIYITAYTNTFTIPSFSIFITQKICNYVYNFHFVSSNEWTIINERI